MIWTATLINEMLPLYPIIKNETLMPSCAGIKTGNSVRTVERNLIRVKFQSSKSISINVSCQILMFRSLHL